MQVTCVFSLEGKDWQDYPYAMVDDVSKELNDFISKNILLETTYPTKQSAPIYSTKFKPAVGTFHDLKGNAIGEIEILED